MVSLKKDPINDSGLGIDLKKTPSNNLTVDCFSTPLGEMVAIADEKHLFWLQFVGRTRYASMFSGFILQAQVNIHWGSSKLIDQVEEELNSYFHGSLMKFSTPWKLLVGTSFQKSVWEAIVKVPYGQTSSYKNLAISIDRPEATRGLAQANAANPLVIVIPCHRVVRQNGLLGGYSGGADLKKWLIEHEKKISH